MEEKNHLRQLKALRKTIDQPGVSQSMGKHLASLENTTSLAKAGYLLRNLTIEDWNRAEANTFKPIKVGIISNFVCDEVQHYLRSFCLAEGICPEVYVADYNQYMWQLLDSDSELYEFLPTITLCVLDEHIFLEKLPVDWMLKDFESCIDSVFNELTQAFDHYFRNCSALLAVNTIVLSIDRYNAIIDYRSKMKLSRLLRTFNARLLAYFEEQKSGIVIDTDMLLQAEPLALRDVKMSVYAKMHFSEPLMAAIARETKKIAQFLLGKTKKCLVLDCDNTLWGGVVGDAGVDGIILGASPEGEAFAGFQAVIRQLSKQGVILTLNSKNNPENTDAVFKTHKDAALKLTDFASQCVNWEPKHLNIKTISDHLNIGLDHMVFVDDSDFECDMVNKFLPSVTVLKLSSTPEHHVQRLLSQGWFNTHELTEEDYSRGEKYKAESARKQEQSKYQSVDDYLHSLAIRVSLSLADSFSIPRIAQITQRTNQFNLSTQRMTEQEVHQLSDSKDWLVIAFEAEDKFGSSGIVGVVFIEITLDKNLDKHFHIRNMLMSCRVFSRGIETAVLGKVEEYARDQAVSTIYGYFSPTAKNHKFTNFYSKHGFQELDENGKETVFKLQCGEKNQETLLSRVPWIDINSLTTIEESCCA